MQCIIFFISFLVSTYIPIPIVVFHVKYLGRRGRPSSILKVQKCLRSTASDLAFALCTGYEMSRELSAWLLAHYWHRRQLLLPLLTQVSRSYTSVTTKSHNDSSVELLFKWLLTTYHSLYSFSGKDRFDGAQIQSPKVSSFWIKNSSNSITWCTHAPVFNKKPLSNL